MYSYPKLNVPVHWFILMSSSFLDHTNRSWLSQANSRASSTESRTNASMMSRACTSMMMSWLIFFRLSELRSPRTIVVSSMSWSVSLPPNCFIASLFPARTRSKTSVTSQVHQIWLPTSAIMPSCFRIHCERAILA